MEQATSWSLLDELEDDAPITQQAAQKVRDHAPPGCLICVLEDEEWDDE